MAVRNYATFTIVPRSGDVFLHAVHPVREVCEAMAREHRRECEHFAPHRDETFHVLTLDLALPTSELMLQMGRQVRKLGAKTWQAARVARDMAVVKSSYDWPAATVEFGI